MATEGPSPGADEPEEESAAAEEGSLFGVYRTYVGEPESRRDVYVGFGVFFGGIALGLAGLALFLYSGTQPVDSPVFWQFREVALVFALLAVPAVGVSVAVLLPVGRRTMAASLLGAAVCVVGIAWLTQVYPYQWTEAGNDVSVLSTYAVGVVVLAASTGSSLVAEYVDSATGRGVGADREESSREEDSGPDGDETVDETVDDEDVAADIEDAMSGTSLTWGGVEQEPNTKRLELDMPEAPDVDRSNAESTTETRSSADDVEDAVSGLRRLQGGEQDTARADSPDDQVDALTEFRDQKESEELKTGVDTDDSFLASLRDRLL